MVGRETSSSAASHSVVKDVDLWVFVALLLSCFVVYIRRRVKIPSSALLMLAGIFLRTVGQYIHGLSDSVKVTDSIETETILLLFLPALIFECAFSTEWYTFKREIGQIALLATTVVIMSSLLTAVVIRFILGFQSEFDWYTAVMLGAILSATDHVAVVAQLKEVHADHRLETLIQGETLINEGSVIVIFTVMMNGALETTISSGDIASLFFRLSLGGIALGVGFSIALSLWLKQIVNEAVLETLLTVITTYLLFFTAELPGVHVSGAFATVTFGLYMSAYGKTFISPLIEKTLHEFWHFLGSIAECLILVLGGMLMGRFCIDFQSLHYSDIGYLFALFALLHLVRAAVVIMHWPLLRVLGYGCTYKALIVLIVGALKGTISIALALIVYHQTEFSERIRDLVLFWGVGVSALSILFDSVILHVVVRLLGLESLSDVQENMLVSVTASILEVTNEMMVHMRDRPSYLMVNWDEVIHTSGPEMLFFDMMEATKCGRKVLDSVNTASTADILRQFTETVNITDESIVHETRRRFYTTLKGLFWHEFEEGQCFGPSALALIESANRGLDKEKEVMDDWRNLESSIYPPALISVLNRLSHLPLVGRYFKHLQYKYIVHAYDVCQNFIKGYSEAEDILDEMEIDIKKEVFDRVMMEARAQIELARKFMSQQIIDIYPEVYIYVQTKHASYRVLYSEKKSVEEAFHQGVITTLEYNALLDSLRKKISHLHLKTSPVVPTLLELLRSCYLFKDLTLEELQTIAGAAKEEMLMAGTTVFLENQDIKGVVIMLKGRVKESGHGIEEEHRPGDVVGVQYLLPQFTRTQTRAVTEILSSIAFVSLASLKSLLSNEQFERKMWIQGVKRVLNMERAAFGALGELESYQLDIVFANSSFEKYRTDEVIPLGYGLILLDGSFSNGVKAFSFMLKSEEDQVRASEPCVLLRFNDEFSSYLQRSNTVLTRAVTRFEIKDKLPKLKISGQKNQGLRHAGIMLVHTVFPSLTSGYIKGRRGSLRARLSQVLPRRPSASAASVDEGPQPDMPTQVTMRVKDEQRRNIFSSLLTKSKSGPEIDVSPRPEVVAAVNGDAHDDEDSNSRFTPESELQRSRSFHNP